MRDVKTDTGLRSGGEDWRHRGACRDVDPELFFPLGVSPAAVEQTARARAVCAGCPVLGSCQEWALSTPERYGVWGGLSEQDRRAIRRSRAAVARHAEAQTLPTAAGRGPGSRGVRRRQRAA